MEWWRDGVVVCSFPESHTVQAAAWPEQSFFGLDLCRDFKLSQEAWSSLS
jgi:hypothetical protein